MKMKFKICKPAYSLSLILCAVFITSTVAPVWSKDHDHGHHHKQGKPDETEKTKEIEYLFGNHECPVMGNTVDPESFVEVKQKEKKLVGRIYMCCDGCEEKVTKDFDDLYKKLYRTDPKTGKSKEPRDLKNPTCPMSGEPVLENIWLEYNGMIVHFCCEGCGEEFLEDANGLLAGLVSDKKEFKFKKDSEPETSE